MYNRYIRNDQGTYTRIPEEEPRHTQGGTSPSGQPEHPPSGGGQQPPPPPALPPPARMGRTASAACSGICWTSFT
ncbi:hypothetical protein [Oscillibacter sp.]|uniref:hypothetical protein n=1 Tax=Oscillibacter sp. TaxID=1945593 RepID=UPI00257A17C9|nr:hypothetical protein [Oscillibacter sp.]